MTIFFSRGDRYNIFGVERDAAQHAADTTTLHTRHNSRLAAIIIYYYDTGTTVNYDTDTHMPTHTLTHHSISTSRRPESPTPRILHT